MGKYVLIVTEKPDAARRIAAALDLKARPRFRSIEGVPYMVAEGDRKIVVVSAIGHLYTVAEDEKRSSNHPVFDFTWVPTYVANKRAGHMRKWIDAISRLAIDADEYIDACDYDTEGSIIGYNILKFACGGKEASAKRMKYSTLTRDELQKAYCHLLPHLDFRLIEAGKTRHEVDWLYGINLSRVLTLSVKRHGSSFAVLSIGRVQGPTLKFLTAREEAIRSFVPTPYWKIHGIIRVGESWREVSYEKGMIETLREANRIVGACKGKKGTVERAECRRMRLRPPLPLNTGSLQSEAYTVFGYLPKRTSEIAQALYLDALISYPRTDSQRLPPAIGYSGILKSLAQRIEYRELASELIAKPLNPTEGRKEDPAHPAIYPTGVLPEKELSDPQMKIWDLIVRRFMSTFAEPSERQCMKVFIDIGGERFSFRESRMLKEGWIRFYRFCVQESEAPLPEVHQGQAIEVHSVFSTCGSTAPLTRYDPKSIILKMEHQAIGTKTTRADIIETLYERKYVYGRKMTVTDLGLNVLSVLEKYCSAVVSTALTRNLEDGMHQIQLGGKTSKDVLDEAFHVLKGATKILEKHEREIGEQLGSAVRKSKMEERSLGACPVCHTGMLVILRSKKTNKRFIGCTNYFEDRCKISFPLPQRGTVKKLKTACPVCGFPVVLVLTRHRRAWKFCVNLNCPSKRTGGKMS